MRFSEVTRKQAFLTHLFASGCIFVAVSYLIIFHWYPSFYFFLDGGDRAIATIFFVDVVLGPGLTLLVFKPGKKTLKFDMAVILLLQALALTWGIKSVYTERPATAVFYWGKFSCIARTDADEIALDSIRSGPSGVQRLAFLQRPDTVEERFSFAQEAFRHNSSEVYYYGDKIVPLDSSNVARLQKYELDLDELRIENPAHADTVGAYINRSVDSAGAYRLIPLACRYRNAVAVYDTQQLRITDTLDVDTKLRAKALDIESRARVTVEIKKTE